jgi:hypothetical protein
MEDTFQGVVIDENTHDENLHDFTVIPDPRSAESSSYMVNSIPKSVIRLENFMIYTTNLKGWLTVKQIVPRCNMKL